MNLASLSAHSQWYLSSLPPIAVVYTPSLSFLLFISLFIIINKSLSRSSHSQMHSVQLTTIHSSIPPPFAILECVSIIKNQYKQISVCLSTLICISLSLSYLLVSIPAARFSSRSPLGLSLSYISPLEQESKALNQHSPSISLNLHRLSTQQ